MTISVHKTPHKTNVVVGRAAPQICLENWADISRCVSAGIIIISYAFCLFFYLSKSLCAFRFTKISIRIWRALRLPKQSNNNIYQFIHKMFETLLCSVCSIQSSVRLRAQYADCGSFFSGWSSKVEILVHISYCCRLCCCCCNSCTCKMVMCCCACCATFAIICCSRCAHKCQDLTHSIIQHVKSKSRKYMSMTSSLHTNFAGTKCMH